MPTAVVELVIAVVGMAATAVEQNVAAKRQEGASNLQFHRQEKLIKDQADANQGNTPSAADAAAFAKYAQGEFGNLQAAGSGGFGPDYLAATAAGGTSNPASFADLAKKLATQFTTNPGGYTLPTPGDVGPLATPPPPTYNSNAPAPDPGGWSNP